MCVSCCPRLLFERSEAAVDDEVVRREEPSPNRASDWQEDPLDLSILLSGGKETNQDSLSNGE